MTSSYNLSRRKNLLDPINFGAFQKHIGVCPPGYVSVPIAPNGNCSDWKICVPMNNKDGNPITYPEKEDYKGPYAETRHFKNHLYPNPMIPDQSLQNFYRTETRRNPDVFQLYKEDYFRLPNKFNGTGYDYTRSWDYPEYALDVIEVSDEWNPFHLIQRHEVQKQAKIDLAARKEMGFKPYVAPYLGTFYRGAGSFETK